MERRKFARIVGGGLVMANLQSWLVDLSTPDEILLRCDLARLLPETDPASRQIMMSHGTFLEQM
jgi:hypothetical protein